MKQLKDLILEKLRISKTKENNDFAMLYNLIKEIKSIDLDLCFTGDKKDLNKTKDGGSVYVIVYTKNHNNGFTIWCVNKSGEISDVETIKNNDELYEFLSYRLVNCTPKEFISIIIYYLQDNSIQEI